MHFTLPSLLGEEVEAMAVDLGGSLDGVGLTASLPFLSTPMLTMASLASLSSGALPAYCTVHDLQSSRLRKLEHVNRRLP